MATPATTTTPATAMASLPGHDYEVIIIGGSYAGLSAALALGRSLRRVLIIDNGKPCNRQTPHSHNFLTQDGQTPAAIAAHARGQVLAYPTVQWHEGKVTAAVKQPDGFVLRTEAGSSFMAKKLLFATGVADQMPDLKGFSECWGISVLHCPYCHGYEVRNQSLGVLANGEMAFDFCQLIRHWSRDLTLFTNGPATLPETKREQLTGWGIAIVEKQLEYLDHQQGRLRGLVFRDGSTQNLNALFARIPFVQHCSLPGQLGCQLTETGLLLVDEFQQTSVAGVYAAGDNAGMLRAVSVATAAGTKAGAFINHHLIREEG